MSRFAIEYQEEAVGRGTTPQEALDKAAEQVPEHITEYEADITCRDHGTTSGGKLWTVTINWIETITAD